MQLRKVLTHETSEAAQRCMLKLLHILLHSKGERTNDDKLAQIVGKAVEQATATSDPKVRNTIFETALRQIDDGESTNEARKRMQTCVARSDEIRTSEDKTKVRKQRQFSYFDEMTGWKLVAKPDFIRFARDSRGPVVQVIDEKIAGHITNYQRRFIKFLGLVISLQIEEERRLVLAEAKRLGIPPTYLATEGFLGELVNEFGLEVLHTAPSVQLIIRLLGDSSNPDEQPRDESIGFKSKARNREDLERVREVIWQIEEAFGNDSFPAKLDWNCGTCPFAGKCEKYQQTLADEQTQASEAMAEVA